MALTRRALLGTAPLALALAGCADKSSKSASQLNTEGPGPGQYKMDLGGYKGPEPTTEPITLRIMRQNWNGTADKVFDKQVAAFKSAYPNIDVKTELVPYGDLGQKLRNSFAAKSAPDIVMGETALMSSYVYGQIAVPVGDYLTSDYVNSFFPGLVDAITIDGHVYGVPSFNNTQGVVYNKSIFAQAGIKTPPESTDVSEAWTVEQWFDTFAALRRWMDKSGHESMFPIAPSTYGNGGPGSNYQQLEQTWIRMWGAPDAPADSDEQKVFAGISADGKTVSGYVDNPLAVQGMTNYQKMFTSKWSPTGAQATMFQSGQTAVKFGGSPDLAVKFPQGLSPLPRGRIVAGSDASDAFIVTTQSAHPAEAAALLAAVNTVEVMTKWTEAWGGVPALQPVVDELPEDFNDIVFQTGVAIAKSSYPMPKTPAWFEYQNQMNQSIRDIALGADPATTLGQAAAAIDQQLAKYHR
jgi:ABC-type glycerol-3-phosphate transport system substrate-binding protein